MDRPKIEDFKPKYIRGFAESSSVIKQYSKAQDLYIDHLEVINYSQCCKRDGEQLCDEVNLGKIKKLYTKVGDEWVEYKTE